MAASRIVIIGGGTAGIITARLLARTHVGPITLIEPSDRHFYQPLWTLVGGGAVRPQASVRAEAQMIPRGVRWLRERVTDIDPEGQRVITSSPAAIDYDALVIAPGIQLNWEAIPGLREAVDRGDASTNYSFELAPRTWELIRNFKGGVALFHMPGSPIKCPGAPQKILYLAADHFRRRGVLPGVHLVYGSGTASIYGAPQYAAPLNAVLARYGVDARFNHELVEVHAQRKEAVFQVKGSASNERITVAYDMLHAVPLQSAPDFIRRGPLAATEGPLAGWVKVDKFTLQHADYPNVFAAGDVAGTPNAKTGAAASRHALVAAANLLAFLRGQEPVARYNGYIACPVVTAYGRMLLCELDYSGQPTPSVPFGNPFRERYDMWLLKKYGLPWLYWHVLLRGRKLPFVH
jgi:sulfide:quinone oxidoreductase